MAGEIRAVDNIKYLVKKLTTSGKDTLDERLFKNLKNVCKQSDFYVIKLHEYLFQQFRRKHAEVRYSCFTICTEIFQRSHCFRCLILKDMSGLLDIVFGADIRKGKLEPIAVAKRLKSTAISNIKKWHEKYGQAYDALPSAINYMVKFRNVDFEHMTTMTRLEREKFEEEKTRLAELKLKRVNKVKDSLDYVQPQVKLDLIAFRNCFSLLIPSVKDFFIPLSDEDMLNPDSEPEDIFADMSDSETAHSSLYGSDYVRSSGFLKGVSIKIDLNEIKKVQTTKDNEAIIENLKELVKILNTKWLPKITELQRQIVQYSEGNGDLVKQLINIKNSLQSAVNSYTSVNIVHLPKAESSSKHATSSVTNNCQDSDSDSDFIEVDERDPRVALAMQSEADLLGISGKSSSLSTLANWSMDSEAGTSSKLVSVLDTNTAITAAKTLPLSSRSTTSASMTSTSTTTALTTVGCNEISSNASTGRRNRYMSLI